jgi:hypothetical protein
MFNGKKLTKNALNFKLKQLNTFKFLTYQKPSHFFLPSSFPFFLLYVAEQAKKQKNSRAKKQDKKINWIK